MSWDPGKEKRDVLMSSEVGGVAPQSHAPAHSPACPSAQANLRCFGAIYSINEGCKSFPNVKFLSQLLGPFKLWTRRPLFWKKSITSCQHTHIYKNMTVGQINLSRENRFFSNSVKCTELERERCYFSSMKGKQDLSCLSCLAHFKRRSV